MFWALAQWQKDREAARRERRRLSSRARATALAEGRAEGIELGQRGVILNMWNSAQSEEERERIRRTADEYGIALPPETE